MKLAIGCDHRGYVLKEFLKQALSNKYDKTYEIVDVGCYSQDSVDYPNIALNLAKIIKEDVEHNLGIIICGSGIGVSIAVNKFNFIRGALIYNNAVAKSAKNHNNANVMCLASDYTNEAQALTYLETFLSEKFEGGRHINRVKALENLAKI
jgi:ribose 5-phosphate isomerase B